MNRTCRLWLARAATITLLVACQAPASAQLLGMGNDRAHPENDWHEFETEHFILVYPQHLRALALRAASIAEQVHEPITRGFDVEMSRKTSILLTDEDQIVNGFALPGKMFLWVNQNDYARFFSGDDKWLRKVIAHEYQHNVWFEASDNWMGLFGLFGTPLWFVEGVAEYMTEPWGPYRSDLDVRTLILRNRHDALDPHDSGFSMVRYMADQYGDSTLVHAVHARRLGVPAYARGFRESAGISLDDFVEEWRRVATAHTYALYSQKEFVRDVGEPMPSPSQRLSRLAYAPSGSLMAILEHGGHHEFPVLATVTNDSLEQRREVDHGFIHTRFAFDAGATRLVYAKRHRSTHGSLLWDLKVADLQRGETRWITSGRRASHPDWSPVEDRIVFIAIDSNTTNLYTCDPAGRQVRRLTDFTDDVQILSPRFSPDGSMVAFSIFRKGRSVDLALLDVDTGDMRMLTHSAAYDLDPFWSRDGEHLFFTSDRNADGVPNLYTMPLDGSEDDVAAMSDVGEALYGMDLDPVNDRVVARAMASTDTVRLRSLDPGRHVIPVDPVIDTRLTAWRSKEPLHPLPPMDASYTPERTPARPYRGFRHWRSFQRFILPSPAPWGILAGGLWADVAHRHTFALGLDAGTRHDRFKLRGVYANYETNMLPFGISGSVILSGSYEARFGFLLYGEQLLWDRQSHGQLVWRLPLNLGEHDYAQHDIELRSRFADIEVQHRDDLDRNKITRKGLPQPQLDYRDNVLGLRYRYRKARPQARVFGNATQGHGFWIEALWSDDAWGSSFDYRRVTLDASRSMTTPLLRLPFFLRGRFESTWGAAASQDFTGLRADVPILPMRYGNDVPYGDIVQLEETFMLRGFAENVPGEQALVLSAEWRLPLLPPFPVHAFGVDLDGLTGVLFYDQGRVWGREVFAADVASTLARHTVGWELRLPVRLFGSTVFTSSGGEGQTLSWETEGAGLQRDWYFRLAMVQPY